MNILQANTITKSYTIDSRKINVLREITLNVSDGEFLVVSGSSGSGKSTLLSLLSGLDKPDSGRIFIEDTDITDMDEDNIAPLRNQKIGFVFQSFHLVPSLTALENIMFPAELRGDENAGEKAVNLLARVGLENRATSFAHQLSGGEKQRVAICRALINNPKIVFADEPTGNLDSKNSDNILDLLSQLQKDLNTTLILATHSEQIAKMAHRVLTLSDGRVLASQANG